MIKMVAFTGYQIFVTGEILVLYQSLISTEISAMLKYWLEKGVISYKQIK